MPDPPRPSGVPTAFFVTCIYAWANELSQLAVWPRDVQWTSPRPGPATRSRTANEMAHKKPNDSDRLMACQEFRSGALQNRATAAGHGPALYPFPPFSSTTTSAMSNATVTIPTLLASTWEAAEPYVPKSLYGQALTVLAGLPVLVILLNVLRQLVRSQIYFICVCSSGSQPACAGSSKRPDAATGSLPPYSNLRLGRLVWQRPHWFL